MSRRSYHTPFEIVFFLCPALGVLFSVAGRSRVEMKRRIFGLDGLCRQTDWRWSFRLGKILVPRKYKREWLWSGDASQLVVIVMLISCRGEINEQLTQRVDSWTQVWTLCLPLCLMTSGWMVDMEATLAAPRLLALMPDQSVNISDSSATSSSPSSGSGINSGICSVVNSASKWNGDLFWQRLCNFRGNFSFVVSCRRL